MGGFGSGRWGLHSKAGTVEESRVLDLGQLVREGAFRPWNSGTFRWVHGEQEVASVSYTVRPEASGLVLSLSYRWTQAGGEGEDVTIPVRLETTTLPSGGVRWWGRCPLVVGGTPCTRRVRKLYLPPGETYFGCRCCHRLTYRSVQEHDKRVDLLRRNPEALAAIMGDPRAASINQLMVALKTLKW
jgi:hypothetical protein